MASAMTSLNNGEVHKLMKDWGFSDLKGSGGHLVMQHEGGKRVQITAPGRPTPTPIVALKKAASIVGVSYNEFLDGPRKLKRPATVQPDLAAIDRELEKLNAQEPALVGVGVTTQAVNGNNNGGNNRMSDTTQAQPVTEQETPEPEVEQTTPEEPTASEPTESGTAESNGSGDYGSRTSQVRHLLESNEGRGFRANDVARETGLTRIQATTALMHLAKQTGFTREGRGVYVYRAGAPAAVQPKARPKSKRGPGRPKGSTTKKSNAVNERINRPVSALSLFESVTEIKDGLLLKDENGTLWVAKELQIK